MQVYLVGGAVRDQLLGREVTEHDYVVVGTTPEAMLALGFSQVGADFPVFLHPKTHDEYALARTERKSGKGYLGFDVYAAPDVTLEDDLVRRDLTINAMAIEVKGLFDNAPKTGAIIDPYHGQADIHAKILRHVSSAFAEDPVRVLRLARFASRYAPLGFKIADDTLSLVQKMRDEGELNYLVAERVWAESHKALTQPWIDSYFDSLNQMGVLGTIMPTFAIMFEEAKFGKTWAKNIATNWQLIAKSLRLAHGFEEHTVLKFGLLALLFIRFDSKKVDMDFYHQFCQQLKVPKQYQQFGEFMLNHVKGLDQFNNLAATELFDLIKQSNALKDSKKLQLGVTALACFKLAQQLLVVEHMTHSLNEISLTSIQPDLAATLKGKAIGEEIDKLRQQKLQAIQLQQL